MLETSMRSASAGGCANEFQTIGSETEVILGSVAETAPAMTTPQPEMRAAPDGMTGLVHDLRNLLTPVVMHASKIEAMGEPRSVRGARRILEAAERALALCERGDGSAVREMPDDLHELLSAACRSASARHPFEASIHVHATARVRYPVLTFRILFNLVHNAARAAIGSAGGNVVAIATRVSRQGISIDIRDTGPGFDADHDAWLRSHPCARLETKAGAGVGLPTVLRLVANVGGTLDLVSNGPTGACLRLGLPSPALVGHEVSNSMSADLTCYGPSRSERLEEALP